MREFWAIFIPLMLSGIAGFFIGLFWTSFEIRRLRKQVEDLENEIYCQEGGVHFDHE